MNLPQWHPAFQKDWVTINGNHVFINDGGAGSGKKGGVAGTSYKNVNDLVANEGTELTTVAQYKRLINSGHELAPIKVLPIAGGKWDVEDGKNRLEAFTQLGHSLVPTVNGATMSSEANAQYSAATLADHAAASKV